MADKLLFSVAGARGIVGRTIDADVVTRLTAAFCAVLPEGPLVLGRDTRPSGRAFALSAAGAITASGRDCIDVGVAATPTVEMVTDRSEAVGGVIVTASHNPVEWNALKLLDHRGIFIDAALGERVLAAYESGLFAFADGRSTGHVRAYEGASAEHVEAILGLDVIDVERIRSRRFKVVLDCINGAGSVIAPHLLERLGAQVVEMDCEPSGDFHRDPEPRPENLQALAARVRAEGADVGFACDPDADRLALVDETGRALSEEYTLALAADEVLAARRGPVVVNLSTSSLIDVVADRHGVVLHRTPVGEAHVVARMLETGAVVGGEGNGGVILPALHPGRDAVLGMALILQILAAREQSLSRQVEQYPPFYMTKNKVALEGPFSTERVREALGALRPIEVDTQDGVKAVLREGWIHLRVSNTEGLVRVIAEAPDGDRARALAEEGRRLLHSSWGKG